MSALVDQLRRVEHAQADCETLNVYQPGDAYERASFRLSDEVQQLHIVAAAYGIDLSKIREALL